jgi:hypothetical protein
MSHGLPSPLHDLQVICVNRVTGKNRTVDRTALTDEPWCVAPFEYKVIEGFGFPAVPTRYEDLLDDVSGPWAEEPIQAVTCS